MKSLDSERTGSLLQIQKDAFSFIPHHLSEQNLNIQIDTECSNILAETERALGTLQGVTQYLPNSELFLSQFVNKEAILSSQIEGTQCSLEDIIEVDEETDEMKPVYEVINYINAMKEGISQLNEFPMSTRLKHLELDSKPTDFSA